MKKILFAIVLGLQLMVACDDKPTPKDEFPIPSKQEGVVFIANEGNYQFGNATISTIDRNTNNVFDNVFESVNNRKLGDVLQSILVHQGLVYLVVNNSQKIEIINPTNYVYAGTISGFTSPRYMLAKGKKAYVSEYYANALRVVDLDARAITQTIAIPGWTEEMEWFGNNLYVCVTNRDKVYVINTLTDEVKDSITVGTEPSGIASDANGMLWVLSKGNKSKQINPQLMKINPATKEVVLNLQAGNYDDGAVKLRISADKKQLFWISGNIYKMGYTDTQIPLMPFVLSNKNTFYGLGVDPHQNEVYVSDVIDYVQKSTIYRFGLDGTPKGQFKAGINSGNFAFYKP